MKKIMVFGAFDGLHPGHLDFFKQAKKLGEYLVVSVARDKNVKKFKARMPLFGEKERLELVSNLKIADEVILGAVKNYYGHIKQHKPDVICLGYDQWPKEEEVLAQLKKVGLVNTKVVRLKPYKPGRSKSTIVKKKSVDF